jgi:hypothetical protein
MEKGWLFARMLVRSARVLVRLLAVLMGCVGVRLSLLVLADVVMMRRLVMMVRCGMMVRGGLVMMLARRMFSHGVYSQSGREDLNSQSQSRSCAAPLTTR